MTRPHETYGLPRLFRVPTTILIGIVVGGGMIALIYYVCKGITGNPLPTWLLWFLIGTTYANTQNNVIEEWKNP